MNEEILKPFKEIFAEQQAYYEARAAEYDEWWKREGKYDQGPEKNGEIFAAVGQLTAAFDKLPLEGDVLEVAGGTGIWSEYLAKRSRTLTVVDGSQAMIAENRAKLGKVGLLAKVEYRLADLLRWQPDREYDAIFMSFWISHLPTQLLGPFFETVAIGLKKGGLLLILEGAGPGTFRSKDQMARQGTFHEEDDIEVRTLKDGRRFRIIKRDDTPEGLSQVLAKSGYKPEVHLTGNNGFLYAAALKS